MLRKCSRSLCLSVSLSLSLYIYIYIYLLNGTMDLHMSGLGTLVPEGPCGMFYATRHQFTEV